MHQPAIYPSLAGRTVFITGGGSGIGAAITAGFAGQKSKVAFVDIDEAASRALRKVRPQAMPASELWQSLERIEVQLAAR